MADLRDLTADETSGLQLWLDAKDMESVGGDMVGNNRFSPFEDIRLNLTGAPNVEFDEENGWTVYTEDGLPSAQWEVEVLVTEDGAEVLSW